MNMIYLYRLAHYLYLKRLPILPRVITRLIYLISNSVVPYRAEIGPETRLAYGGIGVVIHSRTRIGRRVIIGPHVTIGRQLDPETIPVIGDNVYIGAGACVLGKIKVGNNVVIGANSVVLRDVPDNSIVAGVPAKVIRRVNVDIYRLLKNMYAVDGNEALSMAGERPLGAGRL